MFRLKLWLLCVVLSLSSCGCGRAITIAPAEGDERCREFVDGDYADFLVVDEERTFHIFDTTDTGERLAVPIDSAESSDPDIVEVSMLENTLGDELASVTLRAHRAGKTTLHIETEDGYSTDEVIVVVESEADLVESGPDGCP